ncbi:hypothetical protein EPUS_08556 [Endocarpon pusillum Z07020]|uniref:Uncharacterized protein n=1 Tax=Endocarpon pusillum (strain Z07020 / HMAS-L-300199) TaxID=1263415 RepID=U1GMC3_ENDPU|nr:uncharacterized protein EPUS_08556 [Endocarpon pusillum Z07020]ERF73413.1 hypothetical protein EPUS_08556 [Endocarpon pusillum Z07020]
MGTTTYHTNDPEISRHVLREGDMFTKITSEPAHPLFYMSDQSALFTCDTDSPAFSVSHKFVPPAMSPRAHLGIFGLIVINADLNIVRWTGHSLHVRSMR